MKHLYLVRHGQTDANKNKLWIGARSLYKLNTIGREEAMEAGAKLRDLNLNNTIIYTSPVERAYQTAKFVQSKLSLPLVPIPDLSEMFFGDLDGIDEAKFQKDFSFVYEQWLKTSLDVSPPNGESGRRFFRRALDIVTKITVESDTSDIVIVTHSGIVKAFLSQILNIDYQNTGFRFLDVPSTTTGSITHALYHDGVFRYLETIGSGIDG